MDKGKSRGAAWEEDVEGAVECRLGWWVGEQDLWEQGRREGHSRRDKSLRGRAGGWEEEEERTGKFEWLGV